VRYPFESKEAAILNREIFETIYFAALTCSNDLSKVDGPYDSFEGSPSSKGILQFDMWGVTPSNRWNWDGLKGSIKEHGLRNSLLIAPMPTASTSQILGNTEGIEPYTSNIFTRRVLAGEFTVVNQYLVKDLLELNLWNEDMRNQLISERGSVQNIKEIPNNLKDLYKTVWEIPQKTVIDLASDRGAFIDQSQSLNIYLSNAEIPRVTSMHFYGWKKGLKTGMYYLRTQPATNAIQFTVDQLKLKLKTIENTSPKKRKRLEIEESKEMESQISSFEPITKRPFLLTDEVFCTNFEDCTVCSS